MALWEYKVISSGKGGFVSPALLEKFLNDLGKEDWEIIQFHPAADNILAFTGLARRSTQRDWTLQDAAAAAAKAEAEKLRAEFEAKFKGLGSGGAPAPAEEKYESALAEKVAPEDGFRKPIDISRDQDPDAPEEAPKDDWDKLAEEDELPSFFDALKPHMRRNQRGQGMSVGTDFLAKKWDLSEDDVKGALVECGFVMPEDEDSKPEYIEYDGDLFWVNVNRRGEYWINTKEKPRQVFRVVQGQKFTPEEPTPVQRNESASKEASAEPRQERQAQPRSERQPQPAQPKAESHEQAAKPEGEPAGGEARQPKQEQSRGPKGSVPSGPELLDKIRPHMRRNRRGPGGSGSTTFLARALRCNEADLMKAFAELGLQVPEKQGDKPVFTEIGEHVWWINKDQRGGVWINGREKGENAEGDGTAESSGATFGNTPGTPSAQPGDAASTTTSSATPANEVAPAAGEPAVAASPETPAAPTELHPKADPQVVFPAVRLLMKETKTGGFAAETGALAAEVGKNVDDLIKTLVEVGLKVPEKAREKPVFVEHNGEIFWLNKNAKDQLWLNAKASKYSNKNEGAGDNGGESSGDKKPAKRPSRPKKKSD